MEMNSSGLSVLFFATRPTLVGPHPLDMTQAHSHLGVIVCTHHLGPSYLRQLRDQALGRTASCGPLSSATGCSLSRFCLARRHDDAKPMLGVYVKALQLDVYSSRHLHASGWPVPSDVSQSLIRAHSSPHRV
ncbi:unnamed protein product [Protopolystoma xenopodis]|uniref:Uncharacterized protein n=1 Tax=Protopolystoma xenopodis TaxID=117903 RepID=A0A3S5CLT4_9PLAT|nr:unnamed protein product [Protopolystoma xenopodis]